MHRNGEVQYGPLSSSHASPTAGGFAQREPEQTVRLLHNAAPPHAPPPALTVYAVHVPLAPLEQMKPALSSHSGETVSLPQGAPATAGLAVQTPVRQWKRPSHGFPGPHD